jgi:hypothetical protein
MNAAAHDNSGEPALWSAVEAALAGWHAAHPDAPLAEIEVAVEEQLQRVRAALLQARVDAVAAQEAAHPACPGCGIPLQRRGQHPRTLTARGGGTLRLERAYYTCSACGTGLFPPG